MSYLLFTLFTLFGLSSSSNITQCNECINNIKYLKNNSDELLNVCRKNDTYCRENLTILNKALFDTNSSDICYNIGFCDRMDFKDLLFSSSNFEANTLVPSYCPTPKIDASYFKHYNKLIAIYDANSFDKNNCYSRKYNKGIFDLKSLWEIEFDSEILYTIDFFTTYGIGMKYMGPDNKVNPCYYLSQSQIMFNPSIYIIGTKHYRYYITNSGKIFKKFKMDGVTIQNKISTWYNKMFIPDSIPNLPNNGTFIMTENTLYYVIYYPELGLHSPSYSMDPNTNYYCRIRDIKIEKIFSFN
mgnify:CR=1 FL=1